MKTPQQEKTDLRTQMLLKLRDTWTRWVKAPWCNRHQTARASRIKIVTPPKKRHDNAPSLDSISLSVSLFVFSFFSPLSPHVSLCVFLSRFAVCIRLFSCISHPQIPRWETPEAEVNEVLLLLSVCFSCPSQEQGTNQNKPSVSHFFQTLLQENELCRKQRIKPS